MTQENIERMLERLCKLKNDADEVRKDLVAYAFESGKTATFSESVNRFMWMMQFIDRIDYFLRCVEEGEQESNDLTK